MLCKISEVAVSLARALQNQLICTAPGASEGAEDMRNFVRPLAEEWGSLLPQLEMFKEHTQRQAEQAQQTARDALQLFSSPR